MIQVQWNLGIRDTEGLWKTVQNSEVVLFLRSISMYWIGLGTGVAVPNSQVVPFSHVVLKTGFAVYKLIQGIDCINNRENPLQVEKNSRTRVNSYKLVKPRQLAEQREETRLSSIESEISGTVYQNML